MRKVNNHRRHDRARPGHDGVGSYPSAYGDKPGHDEEGAFISRRRQGKIGRERAPAFAIESGRIVAPALLVVKPPIPRVWQPRLVRARSLRDAAGSSV